MAYYVYLVDDPVAGPTHGQKTGKNSTIWFKSMDITGASPPNPPPFSLVFRTADIDGNYEINPSTNSVTGTRPKLDGDGDPVLDGDGNPMSENIRTFTSTKSGIHQVVKIKLNNAGAGANAGEIGYKYDVIMGANTWDPRVVPL